ncbi:cytochrome P450 [Dendrothele bispora CBS 962.96]|uniref:Cytochrome P450 n=1 Tax=Dendrothele bispora (strain CBS 962.96) TaxID=1314807 RepID=A0A4S8M1S6_DENBC|nr:cytochrome P450 [Dendrothele bispora CBS 962.96]
MSVLVLLILVLGFILLFHLVHLYKTRNAPPGPPGLPIIGNLHQLNTSSWLLFASWRQKYGDIIHLSLGPQPVIILNTHKVAYELLDKRSAIYSDRPRLIVATETLTKNRLLGIARWGERWRKMRRAAHESLKKEVVGEMYGEIVWRDAVLLASGLRFESSTPAENGENSREEVTTTLAPPTWISHLERYTSSLFTAIAYDIPPIHSTTDPLIRSVCSLTSYITRATYPGAHLVEFFPILNYLPSSLPSPLSFLIKWKRDAEDAYTRYNGAFESIYARVEERVKRGIEDKKSFARTLVEEDEKYRLTRHEASWLAASMFVAGADTTANTLAWLIVILARFRRVQEKGTSNADISTDTPRLPRPSDLPHLPYCQAVIREALRWRPVDPLGLPHVSVENDVFGEWEIQKGTILLPNVWSMNRDVDVYGPDADEFKPERFLYRKRGQSEPWLREVREEGHVNFGFGRRICVGKHVANLSVLMSMVMILWGWKVRPQLLNPVNVDNPSTDEEEEEESSKKYVEPKLGKDDEVRDGVVV